MMIKSKADGALVLIKEKVLTSTVCSCDDFGTYLDFHLALP
jgi:hypothetical protein